LEHNKLSAFNGLCRCHFIFEVLLNCLGSKTCSSQCPGAKTPRSHQGEFPESAQCCSTLAEWSFRKVDVGMCLASV